MTLSTPTHSESTAAPIPGDFRQVLAVVDLDAPAEPVLRSAVATCIAHAVPLQVVVLYQRPGFTTDPALAARMTRQLHKAQRRVAMAVSDAARTGGLRTFHVRHVPVRRLPLMDRLGRLRSTVTAELRRQPSSLLVMAAHLKSAAASPTPAWSGPGATRQIG